VTRRRRKKAHVNHERWLISYADFITLLFALFVVMFSAAQVDKKKVSKLAVAIQDAFQELGALPDSKPPLPASPNGPQLRPASADKPAPLSGDIPPSPEETEDLENLHHGLQKIFAPEISRQEVSLRRTPDGLVISLKEVSFFESGSAKVKTNSQSTLGRIASELAQLPYRLRIEGYTDDVPIHNAQFASNWELSATRATEVVRLLIVQFKLSPDRLSAAGYARYHPIADNAAPGGRAQNRRVDIVVLRKEKQGLATARSEQKPSPTGPQE
jgi:chemotaxis protein MotB